METDEERIKVMVEEANRFSKEGRNLEALGILEQALNKAKYMLPIDAIDRSNGLVFHYMGRVEQAKGDYKQAVASLGFALGYRKDNSVDYAYTAFQLFICKDYGKLPISDEDVKETKIALSRAMMDHAATFQDIGNMMQNVAYVEQKKGYIHKAVLFYKMTETIREEADDKRGLALTQARLAEIYWKMMGGTGPLAMSYGREALRYFGEINDVERIEQVKAIFGWE